ncbi:sugar phosphate permease [Salinisphaera hydrothermalis C27AD]
MLGYTLLSAAFFIGFFHRFAPATFAEPIARTFDVGSTALGGLASMQFWVYTLMQIPAGVIVDRYGIRVPASVGTALVGIGAAVLALAPSFALAMCGPALVGFGMSIVFVSVMKNNAIWFTGQRFGFITGCTLLTAAMGSIASEAPAALLLRISAWQPIFLALSVLSLILAALLASFWRPPPAEDCGQLTARNKKERTKIFGTIRSVIARPQIWLIMLAISGTNGTFYAFAGLWGTPLLVHSFGFERDTAALAMTLSLVPYGLGSLFLGQISDKLRTRKAFIIAASGASTVAWVWLVSAGSATPVVAWICFVLLGLSSSQVVASFAAVKESVPDEATGTALSLVNMGVFLTTAIVQFGYGWLVASAGTGSTITGDLYRIALWLPAAISIAGLLGALKVSETFPREQHQNQPANTQMAIRGQLQPPYRDGD